MEWEQEFIGKGTSTLKNDRRMIEELTEFIDLFSPLHPEGLYNIVFGYDMKISAVIFGEDGAIFPAYQRTDPFNSSVKSDYRIWSFNYILYFFVSEIRTIVKHDV